MHLARNVPAKIASTKATCKKKAVAKPELHICNNITGVAKRTENLVNIGKSCIMWQTVPCIKCKKYKNKGDMIKAIFKTTNATYGYICKTRLKKEEQTSA